MASMKRTQVDVCQSGPIKRPCSRANYCKANSDDAGAKEAPNSDNDLHVAPSKSLVWATNRQSLCDALPYFKSHQGGVYTKDCFPRGILFARNGEVGDTVSMNKCIYSLGGGRELKEDGTWSRAGEYEPSHFKQWKITQDKQLPVMVIMDCRHPDFSNIDISSIPCQSGMAPVYIVLGAFFVIEMWQEVNNAKEREEYPIFKVMLQRIGPNAQPSCGKDAQHTPQNGDAQASLIQYTCAKCGEDSPAAFKDTPSVCLNKECKDFFNASGVQLQRHTLEYSQSFFNYTKSFSGDQTKIPDTVPPPPGKDLEGYGTELRCRTGMVCPDCLHCDSRIFFNYWKCSGCGLVHMGELDAYPMAGIEKETREHTKKLLNSQQSHLFKEDGTTIFMASRGSTSGKNSSREKTVVKKKGVSDNRTKEGEPEAKGFVTKTSIKDERSTRTTYIIFDANHNCIGSLVHERPSVALKEASCGANELWNAIQDPEATKDFKRNAARCSGSAIETLTRHFTQNFGAHYDFGVKVDDTSFDAAPDVVLKSLVQLSHMGKQAVESTQKILQEQGYQVVEGSTIMDPWKQPNEVLALAYMEKDNISYHDDGEEQLTGVISTLSLGSPASMKVRFKRIKADKQKGIKGSKAYLVLDVQLQHGDVVTMCDTRLQAFTEHTIVPVGIRRFAMTSRLIKEDYYLEQKAAKKLEKLYLTLEKMKESAQIPARATDFVFEGTKLEIA